jgi:hypothetical protein
MNERRRIANQAVFRFDISCFTRSLINKATQMMSLPKTD